MLLLINAVFGWFKKSILLTTHMPTNGRRFAVNTGFEIVEVRGFGITTSQNRYLTRCIALKESRLRAERFKGHSRGGPVL
jgi:hypothetical protein